MKKILFIVLLLFVILIPTNTRAQRGCCSHHGGVSGCSASGRQVCSDGTLSPSCRCTPPIIYGCTDRNAKNYNSKANKDNGTCIYYRYGCTNLNSINYDESAEKDDGSCIPIIYGCMDENAKNYNVNANTDDNSCYYKNDDDLINKIYYDFINILVRWLSLIQN